MRADEGWRPRTVDPWTPTTWVSTSSALDVSGDAVLACFFEMPRSGIGKGYVLSLADGTLRFMTKVGPIQETRVLGSGAFLARYHGGTCEAVRYERDGKAQTSAGNPLFFDVARDLLTRLELCARDDRLRCTRIATAEESAYFAFNIDGQKSWQLVRVDS